MGATGGAQDPEQVRVAAGVRLRFQARVVPLLTVWLFANRYHSVTLLLLPLSPELLHVHRSNDRKPGSTDPCRRFPFAPGYGHAGSRGGQALLQAPDPAPRPVGWQALEGSFRDPSGFVYTRDGTLYRQVNTCFQQSFE